MSNKQLGTYIQIAGIALGVITFLFILKSHAVLSVLLVLGAVGYFVGRYIKESK